MPTLLELVFDSLIFLFGCRYHYTLKFIRMHIFLQISSAETDQELANIMNDDVCANVLSHSGCTTVINVSY